MPYETLELGLEGQIATVTLNRPEKRNALSPQMIEELLAALDDLEKGPARVVILTGAGKAFCAGMDLVALQEFAAGGEHHHVLQAGPVQGGLGCPTDENIADSRRMARFFRRIYEFPKPLVAAVNGAAIGGGCGMAMLCDFTLAVPQARFGYTEVRIGFVPAIVSVFLVRQVGEKVARDLLLTGRLFDAKEAYELGLVNDVTEPGALLEHARALATRLLEASPTSLAATKRLLCDFTRDGMDRDFDLALEQNARIRTTADFREGLSAFLEKRKPKWQGE